MIPTAPLLWLISKNFWYLLAVQAFGGLVWAEFTLSAGNLLYDMRPGKAGPRYSGYTTWW
jgi:hypothetical protein